MKKIFLILAAGFLGLLNAGDAVEVEESLNRFNKGVENYLKKCNQTREKYESAKNSLFPEKYESANVDNNSKNIRSVNNAKVKNKNNDLTLFERLTMEIEAIKKKREENKRVAESKHILMPSLDEVD